MGPAAPGGWVADVAELVGLAVAGRILLAWLPPGRPGSHQGRALVATWAASHLIGVAGLMIGRSLAKRIGVEWRTALVVACAALALLLVARLLTSPAALVPRHEPVPARWSWPSRILVLVVVAALAFTPEASGARWSDALTLAHTVAMLVFVAYGLALARAPASVQSVACAVIAAFVLLAPLVRDPEVMPVALAAAAAAAGTVGWLRHGDARALALAAIALAFAATDRESGSTVAVALALWIVIGTPRPSRLRAAAWCGGAGLVGLAAGGTHLRAAAGFLDESAVGVRWTPVLLTLVAAGIVAGWLADRRRTPRAWNPSGAARGHEGRILLGAVVTAFALALAAAILAARFELELGSAMPFVPAWVLFAFVGALGLTRWVVERPETP